MHKTVEQIREQYLLSTQANDVSIRRIVEQFDLVISLLKERVEARLKLIKDLDCEI